MSVARSAFGSCLVDGILYVFGGDSSYKSVDDFDTTTYIECYDPKKGAWRRVARLCRLGGATVRRWLCRMVAYTHWCMTRTYAGLPDSPPLFGLRQCPEHP